MMVCKECKKDYSALFKSKMSRYCSDVCRKIVKSRANKNNKNVRKEKLNGGDVNWIANDIYIKYKQRSPRRNLEFTLSLDFFKKNVNANCYYCDEKIQKVGFDRIDNSKGYIEGNCVPCCTVCNLMKRDLTLDCFLKKCKEISDKAQL